MPGLPLYFDAKDRRPEVRTGIPHERTNDDGYRPPGVVCWSMVEKSLFGRLIVRKRDEKNGPR